MKICVDLQVSIALLHLYTRQGLYNRESIVSEGGSEGLFLGGGGGRSKAT